MKAFISTKDHYLTETPILAQKGGLSIKYSKEPDQTMIGFGGAFTDSSAHVYSSLPETSRKEVMRLLFGDDGLRYSLGRLTIGSCDFSIKEYDYCKNDDLSDFSIIHDEEEIIPMIKDASKIRPISFLASSWSPLGKWKTSGEKCHGGKLLNDRYGAYANYIRKFVEAYRDHNINVTSLTIQNEPEATQTWESCLFSSEEERRLLIRLHEDLPLTNLYIHDHNRDRMFQRSSDILSTPEADAAAYGIAYHWYDRNAFDEVRKTHEAFKDKTLIFSEGCVETLQSDFGGLGDFSSALRYAKNYIEGINGGTSAFIDWNILLDEKGGPNHVGNYCEAPLMKDGDSIRILPSYYAIKHFSHFIAEGAKAFRINSLGEGVVASLLQNPNGEKVLIVLNEGKETKIVIEDGRGVTLPPSSIATIIL